MPSRFRPSVAGLMLLSLSACAGEPSQPAAATPWHVVIITVDGLRPDALSAAPNLSRLASQGAVSLTARSVDPPETLPSHISMVTGQSPAKHGITYNKDRRESLGAPNLFRRVRDAGWTSGLYFGKSKIAMLARPGLAEVVVGPGPDESDWQAGASAALAARFTADWARKPFRLAWIHLREPDMAGHDVGWMTPAYLDAVRESDAAVGVIVEAIADSPAAASTAVIVTSDHGGEGQDHWGKNAADWSVPWICRVPGAARGAKLRDPVSVMDTAPTALALLGLASLPAAEGRVVGSCLPGNK